MAMRPLNGAATKVVQTIAVIALVGSIGTGAVKIARTEDRIAANTEKLSVHGEALDLLLGTHAQRESLMATYLAMCNAGKFGKNSSECLQAEIWKNSKKGG